eukprot:915588-Pelagomonas_calceolata.AAC.1
MPMLPFKGVDARGLWLASTFVSCLYDRLKRAHIFETDADPAPSTCPGKPLKSLEGFNTVHHELLKKSSQRIGLLL